MGREIVRRCVLMFVAVAGCELTCAPTCSPRGEIEMNQGVSPAPDASARACPGTPRSGITECFPGECGPGQFCDERAGSHGSCRPGCTSDQGCGPRDVCVREASSAIGRCEPCAEQAPRSLDACGARERSGSTPCFPGSCGPGQYCIDEGMPHCEPGCTSDENCGPTERCEREGTAALGVCRSCAFAPPA